MKETEQVLPPLVLSIAGSDPGGGAGIQGDIKAIHANGAYALSVLSAVTAQNTIEVSDSFDLPPEIIQSQLKAVFGDFKVSATKTGMLSSEIIVECVADFLKQQAHGPLVVDPVMVSSNGYPLLKPSAILSLKKNLIPLAALLTPNVAEAEILSGCSVINRSDAVDAVKHIYQLGCDAVLLKGGHLSGAPGCDLLYDGISFTWFEEEWIETRHGHGTGCTYSAAIASYLAQGKSLTKAVSKAKRYVSEAIRHGLGIGHGQGPTNHFYSVSFLSR